MCIIEYFEGVTLQSSSMSQISDLRNPQTNSKMPFHSRNCLNGLERILIELKYCSRIKGKKNGPNPCCINANLNGLAEHKSNDMWWFLNNFRQFLLTQNQPSSISFTLFYCTNARACVCLCAMRTQSINLVNKIPIPGATKNEVECIARTHT